MAGCTISHTPIAVDHWKRRDLQGKVCFLSHLHGDHIEGLNSSWNQTIYCSEITRSLAIEKLRIMPSVLVAIPVGESTIIPLDDAGVEKMTVTLIDANHCPGAVMFLFQGYFGCILYTGDFRYFDGMLDQPPFTNDIVINRLYLDNTYCDPKCEFPSRAEAKETILQILRDNPDKDIVFGLDKLGKEELLYEVAKDQNTPIVVDEFRYKTAELLGIASFFTTNPEESYIRVTGKRSVNRSKIASLNRHTPTIGIIPTCLYQGSKNCNKFANCDTIFVVPYSDHSSFTELKTFVAKVKPQNIIPVVKEFMAMEENACDRTDMSIFAAEMSHDAEAHVIDIPSTVVGFMSRNKNGNAEISGKKRKASTSYFSGKSKRASGIVFSSPQKQAAVCQEKNPILSEQDTSISKRLNGEQQIKTVTDVGSSNSIEVEVDIHSERASKTNDEKAMQLMEDERPRIKKENEVTQKTCDKSVEKVSITSPDTNLTCSQLTEAKCCEYLSQLHHTHTKCGKQNETQHKGFQSIKLQVGSAKDVAQITADDIAASCPTVSLEPTESQKTRNSVPLVVSPCPGDEASHGGKNSDEDLHDSKELQSSEDKRLSAIPFTMKSIKKICDDNDIGTQKPSYEPIEVVGLVHTTSLPDNDQVDDQGDLSLLVQAMRIASTPGLKKTSLPNGTTCHSNKEDVAQNTGNEQRKKDVNDSERSTVTTMKEQDEKNNEDFKFPNSAPLIHSTPKPSGTHYHEKNSELLMLSQDPVTSPEDLQLNTHEVLTFLSECLESNGSPKCTSAQSESCTSNTEMSGDIHQENEIEQGLFSKEYIPDETSENQVKLKQSSEIEETDDPQISQDKNSSTYPEATPKLAAESDNNRATRNEDANTQEPIETNEFQKGAFEEQEANLVPLQCTEAPVIEEADSTINRVELNKSHARQSGQEKDATSGADAIKVALTKSPINESERHEEEYHCLTDGARLPTREKENLQMTNSKLSSTQKLELQDDDPHRLAREGTASDDSQITHISMSQELSESEMSEEYPILPHGLANPPTGKNAKSPQINKVSNSHNLSKSQNNSIDHAEERANPTNPRKTHLDKKADDPKITHNEVLYCPKCKRRKRVRRKKLEESADDPPMNHSIVSTAQAPGESQSRVSKHQDAGQGSSKKQRKNLIYTDKYAFAMEYVMKRTARDSKK